MNLNNIEIPDFIVRELYHDHLIAPTPGMSLPAARSAVLEKPAPVAQTAPSLPLTPAADGSSTSSAVYKFLGHNRRKVTVLVQSPGVAFLPDEQLAFLTKMLEACRMNIGDVAIVNQASAPVNINPIKQQLQPSYMLLFGIQPVEIKLPINFPLFKIQAYDQCTYLYAPSLDELVSVSEDSKILKGKLWGCLKTMFEI